MIEDKNRNKLRKIEINPRNAMIRTEINVFSRWQIKQKIPTPMKNNPHQIPFASVGQIDCSEYELGTVYWTTWPVELIVVTVDRLLLKSIEESITEAIPSKIKRIPSGTRNVVERETSFVE